MTDTLLDERMDKLLLSLPWLTMCIILSTKIIYLVGNILKSMCIIVITMYL